MGEKQGDMRWPDDSAETAEEAPLAPHAAWEILSQQRQEAARDLAFNDRLVYSAWGLAYLLGFLPLAMSVGPHAPFGWPRGLVMAWFSLCIIIGIAVSITVSVRASRGLRGPSQLQGTLYGCSWFAGFTLVGVIGARLGISEVLSPDDYGMAMTTVSLLVVGLLFLAGGAMWPSMRDYVIGVWMLVATAIATLLGLPAYYWIMAFGCGGGLLIAPWLQNPIERRLGQCPEGDPRG